MDPHGKKECETYKDGGGCPGWFGILIFIILLLIAIKEINGG